MTFRPALAHDPRNAPRESARVARVAAILDCDESDVRRMVNDGVLEAHGKGVRGVRVFLDSVRDYQDARHIQPRGKPRTVIHKPKARSSASTAAHRAAVAGLVAKGLV